MSNEVNTKLLEHAWEVFDDLHKYDQKRMEQAVNSNDLDSVREIVTNFEEEN